MSCRPAVGVGIPKPLPGIIVAHIHRVPKLSSKTLHMRVYDVVNRRTFGDDVMGATLEDGHHAWR